MGGVEGAEVEEEVEVAKWSLSRDIIDVGF